MTFLAHFDNSYARLPNSFYTRLDPTPVREFAAFTGDLHRLADWLVALGIRTVAMESTGVYWIPLYEILEDRGLEVLLVDARHVRNVPGRKSDVLDCQWLQQLHTYGLLRGAFRPPDEMVRLRAYLRQRERLLAAAADSIRLAHDNSDALAFGHDVEP